MPVGRWLMGKVSLLVTPQLLAAFALMLLGAALPAHAETAACPQGISRVTTERLFAILNHPPAEAGCTFEGIETDRARLEARWSYHGARLPPIAASKRLGSQACGCDRVWSIGFSAVSTIHANGMTNIAAPARSTM